MHKNHQFRFRPRTPARTAFSVGRGLAATTTMLSVEMMALEPRLTPRDEAVFLLHTAAEIEHALLVQYLYAAYSVLPQHPGWQAQIRDIAVQEMGHLVSMQNVLHLLGGPLTLDREDFPFRGAFYPFHFKLEPLSLDSLAKYVVAEMPEQEITPELEEIIERATGANAEMEINRVGALFERIGELFDDLTENDINPGSADTVQAEPGEWKTFPGGAVIVEKVRTLAEARELLHKIAVQGEGGDMAPDSHYMTFLEIYRELRDHPGTVSRDIPASPNTAPEPHCDPELEAGRITDEEARRWAHVGDLRYRMLLAFLLHALHLDRTTSASARMQLADWTFQAMYGTTGREGVKGINSQLMTLPQRAAGDTGDGAEFAALPFQLPYTLEIPPRETDRWRLHLDLLDASESVLDDVTSGHDLRDRILAADDMIRKAIEAAIAELGEEAPPRNDDAPSPPRMSPPRMSPPRMTPAPSDGSNSTTAFMQLMRDRRPAARVLHDGITADGGSLSALFENEDYDAIIDFLTSAQSIRPPFANMPLVTPGNPSKSAFYLHISRNGGRMRGRFSLAEEQIVEQWIRDLPTSGGGGAGLAAARVAGSIPLKATEIASGLSRPLFVTAPPGDTSRVFIVEKSGDIKILNLATGAIEARPFLKVDDLSTDVERGLLGLAFHPNYAENRQFYVNCTDAAGRTTVRRYLVSTSNPNAADPDSRAEVISFDQPFANHNGGWIAFGPNDGALYIASGDGGSGDDPFNNAQNLTVLLGKMLRIDVDGDDFPGDLSRNYAIPVDNPFVRQANARHEIWALGLRNPWRCSFDRQTGDLYIGDVGQTQREEIDFQRADSRGGENYGWRIREGSQSTGLDPDPGVGLTNPIYEYNPADGRTVIGGYVYGGQKIAGLAGTYFYADFSKNRAWSFRFNGASISQHVERTSELSQPGGPISSISSFGEDAQGELYITSFDGIVYRIEA